MKSPNTLHFNSLPRGILQKYKYTKYKIQIYKIQAADKSSNVFHSSAYLASLKEVQFSRLGESVSVRVCYGPHPPFFFLHPSVFWNAFVLVCICICEQSPMYLCMCACLYMCLYSMVTMAHPALCAPELGNTSRRRNGLGRLLVWPVYSAHSR